MDRHPAEQTLSLMDTVDEQQQEIETLRRSLADAMEINSEVRDERDEWKRRFKFVVDLCMDDEWKQMVSKADPEFAGWLEEE